MEGLMGQRASQAGQGQAPARQAMRLAGLPDGTGATTINNAGMESMSNAPYLLPKARNGCRTDISLHESVCCGARGSAQWGRTRLQQSSGAHGRNGRDPAVDQEVCSDDIRRIVGREVNSQLRDFRRISHALAGIVGCKDALDRIALLFTGEATEHSRVRRAWA